MTNDNPYRFTPELETACTRVNEFGDEIPQYGGKCVDQFGRGLHPESPEYFVDITPDEVKLQRRSVRKLIENLKWRVQPKQFISIIGHPNRPEPYIPQESFLDKNVSQYMTKARAILRKLSKNESLLEEELNTLNDMSREVFEEEEHEADVAAHYDCPFSYGSFKSREDAEKALKEFDKRVRNSRKESVYRRAEAALREASCRSLGKEVIKDD